MHQRRGDREPDDRGEEGVFDAKLAGEPAGQRHHDRRGDDLGRQHPRDLVLRRRHAPLDVRQADIDDRRVEPLHDAGADDRRGRRGPVGYWRGAFSPHSSGLRSGPRLTVILNRYTGALQLVT